MERHKLGTSAGGVAGMKDICHLLDVGVDPVPTFQEYSEIVGTDFNNVPIEAGFARASWTWDVISQTDFNRLLDFTTNGFGNVYLRTRNNSGASGFDFADYSAVMTRPKASSQQGLLARNVVVEFVGLEAA